MIRINKKDKLLIENHAIAFATVDSLKKPNVIGVAYVKVVASNKVLITDNFMKHTRQNLQKNNNVCLAVWDKSWHGIKLVGKAKYYINGPWKKYVETMPENKGLSAKGAIVVTINKLLKLA
ncbi:MAG: pyridoxamine 5'-phosphate oxidase family protein [Patescibacteria group bacterium]